MVNYKEWYYTLYISNTIVPTASFRDVKWRGENNFIQDVSYNFSALDRVYNSHTQSKTSLNECFLQMGFWPLILNQQRFGEEWYKKPHHQLSPLISKVETSNLIVVVLTM